MTDQALPHAISSTGTEFRFPNLWRKIKATLKTWGQRDHDRRFLAQMSAYERRDLFIPDRIFEQEVAKPFWRA